MNKNNYFITAEERSIAIKQMDEIIKSAATLTPYDEGARNKHIHILATTIVDYCLLDSGKVGSISEAYQETVD